MSRYDQEYMKAHQAYRTAVKGGAKPEEGKSDKAKAMNDIRQIERTAARDGVVLSAQYRGEKIEVSSKETETKRSLQEEYCRKFDNETRVEIGGEEQTLRQYHERRLLGRR